MAQIIIRQRNRDEVIELTKDVITLGRVGDNDIVLRGDGVSRRHCEIRRSDDGYTMIDLGSRNGTYINGARITEQRLSLGDRIDVGDALIIFEKEIPRQEEVVEKQADQSDNFVAPTPKSHLATIIFVSVIIAGVVGIVLWRLTRPSSPVSDTNNLLRATTSFEGSVPGPALLPLGWKTFVAGGTRVLITEDEKHMGNKALLIDRINSADLYTTCYYDKISVPPDAKSIAFGGWIKSDAFNKSAAGFKLEWFRQGEANPFLESYSSLAIPKDQWQDISITVPIPPRLASAERADSYEMQFSCIMLGKGSKIYFDDVRIIPSAQSDTGADRYLVEKEIDELKLRGYYNGTWSVFSKNNELLLRAGNLVIKSETGVSQQNFSARSSKGVFYPKMFFPDSSEWLDYEMKFSSSLDALSVKYSVPFQKLFLKMEEIYLRYYIPAYLIEDKLKMRGETVKEVSPREGVKEKNISRLELPMSTKVGSAEDGYMLVIKYPIMLDISITPQENELEIIQGIFDKERISRYRNEGVPLEVTFEWKPVVHEPVQIIQRLLKKGQELEAEGRSGAAMEIYLDVLGQAEKGTPFWNQAQQSLKQISDSAQQSLYEIEVLVKKAELLAEEDSFKQVEETCRQIITVYKDTKYAQQAELFLNRIQEMRKSLKEVSLQKKQKALLPLAEGYFKEEKWGIARVFIKRIIALDSESPEGKRAKEMLEIIEQRTNSK